MSNKNYPKRKRKMSEKTKFKLALKSHNRLAKYHSEQYQVRITRYLDTQ